MDTKKQYNQGQKLAVLESAAAIGMKEAAKLAGVHYTTIYEWRNQLTALGEDAFLAKQTISKGRGVKQISEAQEKAILTCWKNNPGFGPGQIRNQLRRQGLTVSTRTVQRIMQANGYVSRTRRAADKKGQRFEATRPLELVQMDILEFYINKLKVYLLLLQDDFSRFIVGWRLTAETSIDWVIATVQEAIDRYGKMEEILSDRGFVFYSWNGCNRLEKYLETEVIHQTHARPHHPQTLGKVEATNKQVQKELLRRQHFDSVAEGEEAIGQWVKNYNYQRTHQGLGGLLVPADRFHGRTAEVTQAIADHLDPAKQTCYEPTGIGRNLCNVLLLPDGTIRFYLFGQLMTVVGGKNGGRIDS
jgi:transposase InsO family protein